MTPSIFFTRLVQLAVAGSILLLGHYGYGIVAAALVLGVAFMRWLRSERQPGDLADAAINSVFGLAIVILISLNRPPFGQSVFPVASQVALAAIYGSWLMLFGRLSQFPALRPIIMAVAQVTATAAIFLASAYWRWPELIVVAATWASAYVAVWWYLLHRRDRAVHIMAATWALVVSQISWVLYAWQVNYVVGETGYLIIPQAAIVVLGIGYCLVSIYATHARKQLSRRLLIEYVAIAGVLLAIVIAGTHWNSTA